MIKRKAKPADEPRKAPQQEDLYAVRRKKRRRRHLRRAIIFVCVAALLILLYQRREDWIPKLEEINLSHQAVQQNDGTLSEGNFPLSIYGGASYQTAALDNVLLILSDTYLYLYQTDGSLLSRRQHAYGSAMLQCQGSYALVYESGGTHFRLEGSSKTYFEKNVSDPIVFARVSDAGYTAVVTGSDTSACKLIVYNKKGKQIYMRNCVEKLTEVSFRADHEGCYGVTIHAEGGSVKSVVHNYDFAKKEENWASQPLDMLCISVYNTNGDNVFVMGDTCCAYLSFSGATLGTYVYPDALVCGDSADGAAAVVLRNEEKRENSLVLLNGTTESPKILNFEGEIKCVDMDKGGNYVTVQMRDQVQTFGCTGGKVRSAAISDTYDKFVAIGDYLFMMGYDRIDRLDYTD